MGHVAITAKRPEQIRPTTHSSSTPASRTGCTRTSPASSCASVSCASTSATTRRDRRHPCGLASTRSARRSSTSTPRSRRSTTCSRPTSGWSTSASGCSGASASTPTTASCPSTASPLGLRVGGRLEPHRRHPRDGGAHLGAAHLRQHLDLGAHAHRRERRGNKLRSMPPREVASRRARCPPSERRRSVIDLDHRATLPRAVLPRHTTATSASSGSARRV
jgi:hypothetical protein